MEEIVVHIPTDYEETLREQHNKEEQLKKEPTTLIGRFSRAIQSMLYTTFGITNTTIYIKARGDAHGGV